MGTKIEWTDQSWNPVTGCSRGCSYCYARKMARRLKAMGQPRYRDGFAPTFHPEALAEPLRWRKPRMCFVCSMGDLFGPEVTNEQIAAVFGIMAACSAHTFQVLTKCAERMREWFRWTEHHADPAWMCAFWADDEREREGAYWPLSNVWIGCTAENQAAADERIPLLLKTPAAIRFVSCEPLLEPVDLQRHLTWALVANSGERLQCPDPRIPHTGGAWERCLDWVIAGADSTRGAPPMQEDWVRSIRDQCVSAGVPFFYKQQRVENGRKVSMPELDGKVWNEFPGVTR